MWGRPAAALLGGCSTIRWRFAGRGGQSHLGRVVEEPVIGGHGHVRTLWFLQAQSVGTLYTRTLGRNRYCVLDLDNVPVKAIQLRMARAAVGWGVRELAEKAGVTANTVTRIENGADAKQSTMDRLQRALEAAGVEFTNSDQPGVRLTKAAAARSAEPSGASKPTVAAKAVRTKTKATDKKR